MLVTWNTVEGPWTWAASTAYRLNGVACPERARRDEGSAVGWRSLGDDANRIVRPSGVHAGVTLRAASFDTSTATAPEEASIVTISDGPSRTRLAAARAWPSGDQRGD